SSNAPMPGQDSGPERSATLEALLSPPANQPTSATTSCGRTAAPAFNPNPLANIAQKSPTAGTPESASAQNNEGDSSMCPAHGSAGCINNEQAPLKATPSICPTPNLEYPDQGPTNCSDNKQACLTAPPPNTSTPNPLTSTPTLTSETSSPAPDSNAGPSDGVAGSDPGTSNRHTSSSKLKKANIMHPGKTKTARNLFAINYLKDHAVMYLDKKEKAEYKQRAEDTKKTPAE
ncbi:hypothetical protein V8E53_004972, partial [Lactarius tabidus]